MHALVLAAALLLAGPAAGRDLESCAVPEPLAVAGYPLPDLAKALKAGADLRVVVLGSASSTGAGVSAPDKGYVHRLQAELAVLFPGRTVVVENRSARGRTAAEMLALIETEIVKRPPALLVWQTGTVDAVNNVDVGEFGTTIENGIAHLHAHRVDVVLVTPQFSRRSTAMVNFEPYIEQMEWAAASQHAVLFHRFDIMQYWVEAGVVDFRAGDRDHVRRTADQVHDCIGRLLAEMIRDGVDAADSEPNR